MGGETFRYSAGTYVSNEKYNHIMMAMDTALDTNGCSYKMPEGTLEEIANLDASYEHLCKMRDELVTLNIVPEISKWSEVTLTSNKRSFVALFFMSLLHTTLFHKKMAP